MDLREKLIRYLRLTKIIRRLPGIKKKFEEEKQIKEKELLEGLEDQSGNLILLLPADYQERRQLLEENLKRYFEEELERQLNLPDNQQNKERIEYLRKKYLK